MMVAERVIQNLLRPAIEALGCQLWGVDVQSGARKKLLRIYIDRDVEHVSVDDCERVSRQVASLLDVEDVISGEYTLEVSSPGMDRPLYEVAHFEKYVGEEIVVKLRFPYEKRKNFKGILQGVVGDEIIILVADNEYLFPIEGIDRANLVPKF